jgi:hypothetical protein
MAASIVDEDGRIINAYVDSTQGKMQQSLQDMILNAGIEVSLFSVGVGFSMVYYIKWYRNVQPIL